MTRELLTAFAIMGICLVIHVTGIAIMGEQLIRVRDKIEAHIGFATAVALLISIFIILILLHLGQAAIWAGFYDQAGLFKDFETSLYFSLKSYSTVGYGDVLLPQNWRLLGTIEGISGVLLCGLSAAFLFAIINGLFRFRVHRFEKEKHKRLRNDALRAAGAGRTDGS
jgi:ion channel